ncbi:MAG TPA: hypothetical protein VNU26_07495 [Mycobacteriales bacterium]|nr:hypothetical protein [Mycobacteriales bacterium]
MTEPNEPNEPNEPTPELGEPTDVSVSPEELEDQTSDSATPTSSASRYEEGDSKGGTGGLDAGGAG